MVRAAIIALFNKLQRLRNGSPYPFIEGKLKQSPVEVLNLQPGELVEVKSKAEILATLHLSEKNRGLSFDSEMVRHCGRQFRVLRRVERIIDEKTGTLTHMKGDCIVLDGAVCAADYHRFCPRSIYPYWREIWLRRAGDARRGPELPLPRIDRLLDRWLPLQGCSKTTAAACETIPVHPLPR
jgi:hypothetical protein